MPKNVSSEIKDSKEDGPPEPYKTYLPIGFTAVVAVLLAMHLYNGKAIDDTTITLLGVAVIVWFMPLVTRIKIGGSEIELGRRVNDLEARETKLKEMMEALEATSKRSEELLEMVTEASVDGGDSGAIAEEELPPEQLAVLRALADTRYTLRTLTGVFKAVHSEGLVKFSHRGEVEAVLKDLLNSGFARSAIGKSKTKVWGLTPQGRAQVDQNWKT